MKRSIALAILVAWAAMSFALSPLEQLILWELRSRDLAHDPTAVSYSPDPFAVEHYEIPLELVDTDFAGSLDKEVKRSLIFERGGRKFVRWVVPPRETNNSSSYIGALESYLKSKGVDATRHRYFIARRTASRSLILEDPATHSRFSIKGPSQFPPGILIKAKPLSWKTAKRTRQACDFVRRIAGEAGMQHAGFFHDEGALGIPGIDQALLVRSIEPVLQGDHYYLPGFAALDEDIGREIALKNGSTDPATFWKKHYFEALGRAMTEFTLRTGLRPEAGHGQNFLVELDRNLKPTGRIFFRDYADAYLIRELAEKAGAPFVADWPEKFVVSGAIEIRRPLFAGLGGEVAKWIDTDPPSFYWNPNPVYQQSWYEAFLAGAESELAALTGLPLTEIRQARDPNVEKAYRYSLTVLHHYLDCGPKFHLMGAARQSH